MAFASSNEINAIAVENRKFHKQTMVNWMNRTAADPIFKFLAAEMDKKKDSILADLAASAKKHYIPTVVIFSLNECVFDKKPGSREDCRHDPVHGHGPLRRKMTVLEFVTEVRSWSHETPASIIPDEFWEFGGKAPDDQNDFYQTLKESDSLRLLENHLGDNFSCHVDRKQIYRFSQYTQYQVEVSVQFHLTKRPDWRKEQIGAAVKRYDMRQKAIAEDRRMDRWQILWDEDEKLAEQLESIPYPFTGLNAFKVVEITARRKAIYAEMYPEDGPEYDQDDLNKAAVANRHGF